MNYAQVQKLWEKTGLASDSKKSPLAEELESSQLLSF
jgi:hypothetical protein